MLSQLKALTLLSQCTGDEIWSVEHCRSIQVPASWIEELSECFESNFLQDNQTIYFQNQRTNQYHGVRDIDLAIKLGEFLGVDTSKLALQQPTRARLVRAIQDAAEEG